MRLRGVSFSPDPARLREVGTIPVRPGRCSQDWDVVRHPLEYIYEAPIVGAEVVASVGNTVCLVDDQQADTFSDRQQDVLYKIVVRKPLG